MPYSCLFLDLIQLKLFYWLAGQSNNWTGLCGCQILRNYLKQQDELKCPQYFSFGLLRVWGGVTYFTVTAVGRQVTFCVSTIAIEVAGMTTDTECKFYFTVSVCGYTGHFLCQHCSKRGGWHDLQDNILLLSSLSQKRRFVSYLTDEH